MDHKYTSVNRVHVQSGSSIPVMDFILIPDCRVCEQFSKYV